MSDVAKTALPSPDDLPGSAVVVYDGKCHFCTSQVARLLRWDGRGRLSFLSLHDPAVAQLLPGVSQEALMQQMYVVEPGGRYHGGAAALRYLSRRLPRLWWLTPFIHIPGTLPIWQWLYSQVARRRYRISGSTCDSGHCSIHQRSDR